MDTIGDRAELTDDENAMLTAYRAGASGGARVRTPGGSIIFTPQTELEGVRCEVTWGCNAWGLWAHLFTRKEMVWAAAGLKTMQTVHHIHNALAELGMSPADIERVRWT
jgi:hypothetical protein